MMEFFPMAVAVAVAVLVIGMATLWPMIKVAAWEVIAGVAAAWAKFRYNDNTCVLPRLSLIQALQENMERLQFEVDPEIWGSFVEGLYANLTAIMEELKVRDASKGNVNRVMRIIDEKLVHFLRRDDGWPGVASILDSYIPRAGQTWNSFLQKKTNDEQSLFDVEKNGEALYLKLKDGLIESIQELTNNLQKSFPSDADRNVDDEVENVPRTYKIIKVFYATDRQVTTDGEYIGVISRRPLSRLQRGVPLHYGWVEVGIPIEIHKMGSLEAPEPHSDEADPSKHVVILSVNTTLRGDIGRFLNCVNHSLTTSGGVSGELLIFIHGYKTSHLKAVKRAAQLKYDLGFQGSLILYSWSTLGNLRGYFADQTNVKKTVDPLKNFLKQIMKEVQSPRLHTLAHSMGSRALIEALHDLHKEQGSGSLPFCPLSQIIFVAADAERRDFEMMVQEISKSFTSTTPIKSAVVGRVTGSPGSIDLNGTNTVYPRPRLTVYCSSEDWPLALSRAIHQARRLGDIKSFLESTTALGDYDTIDVSGTKEDTYLHHSYHVESSKVIRDIGALLAERRPASGRSNLEHVVSEGKSFYAVQ